MNAMANVRHVLKNKTTLKRSKKLRNTCQGFHDGTSAPPNQELTRHTQRLHRNKENGAGLSHYKILDKRSNQINTKGEMHNDSLQ